MPKKKVISNEEKLPKMRPAISPEAYENQMVSLAMTLAEKQLREGTASSQVVTHFLKIGSMREREEMKRLQLEEKLLEAKAKSLDSIAETKELFEQAIAAMKSYKGSETDETPNIL